MSAASLLDEAAMLSDQIAERDERIAELREEIKSFLNTDPDFVPLALPPDWNYDAVNQELTSLLKQRHQDASAYRELCERQEEARAAEIKQKLNELKARYKEAIVRLLQCSIAFAKAVGDAHALRMECRDLTGQTGHLRHIGPLTNAGNPFDLRDPCSWPSIWCREAAEYKLINGDEGWLSPVNMTGGVRLGV